MAEGRGAESGGFRVGVGAVGWVGGGRGKDRGTEGEGEGKRCEEGEGAGGGIREEGEDKGIMVMK